ncbi:MAG: hypothetical protein ACT4PW_00250 [Acidimicrobiia bacterium]
MMYVVVAVVLVVLVALVAVGREAFTLGAQPRQTVFDLQEAVDYVADRLPEEITAVLSYDDVTAVLRWHLEYLADRGVPVRRDENKGGPVVVEDEESVAWVLGRADEAGVEISDAQVATILEVELGYFRAIGAVGGVVPEPTAELEDPGGRGELPA